MSYYINSDILVGGTIMTNEELIKIFTNSFYITFNNTDSNIRELVEEAVDDESNTINLAKMVVGREKLKDSNPLLYNFLSNSEVIENTEFFINLYKRSKDYKYGYIQIYLEECIDNNFINEFHNKVDSTYLTRNEENKNPVAPKHPKFNLVEDFLSSNNSWGKVDFSNISTRDEKRSGFDPLSFESSYRFYAKTAYSKISIGYKEFTEQVKEIVEDNINKNWHATINKNKTLNPYYVLDYGTKTLVHTLFNDEYWNTYIEAEKKYLKASLSEPKLKHKLCCALANFELALETIDYVLQKDANSSYEPHLYSEIEKYLKAEWSNKPHVKSINDLIHYEVLGSVYPITNDKAMALRNAFNNLNVGLRKEYNIENNKYYSVNNIVKFLKIIYINKRKEEFKDYEKIQDIICEFEGKLKTSSLNEEIDEDGHTFADFISSDDLYNSYGNSNDINQILYRLVPSFEKIKEKIDIVFMFDSYFRIYLSEKLRKVSLRYMEIRKLDDKCLIDVSQFKKKSQTEISNILEQINDLEKKEEIAKKIYEKEENRKSTLNKEFVSWMRVLKPILQDLYRIQPRLLDNYFDSESNKLIQTGESFSVIFNTISKLNLEGIEENLLLGAQLDINIIEQIVSNWFEKNKEKINTLYNNENYRDKCFKFNTEESINMYELNQLLQINNPFIILLTEVDEFLDIKTLAKRLLDLIKGGKLDEKIIFDYQFEKIKSGNKIKPAGEPWSNLWSEYEKENRTFTKKQFYTVMNYVTDSSKIIKKIPIRGQYIYSKIEEIINLENKSDFMKDLRLLFSIIESISKSENEIDDYYSRILAEMKNLGYTFVLKYDKNSIEDDIEIMSYDYKISLEKIITE